MIAVRNEANIGCMLFFGALCESCMCGSRGAGAFAGKFRVAQGLVSTVQNETVQATGLLPASKAEYKALQAESASLQAENAALVASNAQTQALVNSIVAQVNGLTPVRPPPPCNCPLRTACATLSGVCRSVHF